MDKILKFKKFFLLGLVTVALSMFMMSCSEDDDPPEGNTITVSGGNMWLETHDVGTPISNGYSVEEGTRVYIRATPPAGKRFVRWNVTPADAAANFILGVTDDWPYFDMPAYSVTITGVFEDYPSKVKFTWDSAEQGAILSIAASAADVDYWYENDYLPSEVAGGTIPLFEGSPDLPNNIYSQTIGSTSNKSRWFPIEEGYYTAVCTFEDEDFAGSYWDIVANYYPVEVAGTDTYFEVFFDVGGFFSGLTDEYWKFNYDVEPFADYLTKSKARANKLTKVGTKNFDNGGKVTYYLIHRQKKA